MRAAIYNRISDDRREGQALGVARQRADCEALAKRLGYAVVDRFTDNDISASEFTRKARPEYQRLLAAIRDGEVDVVLAWHTDRLHRSMGELEEYLVACASNDVATVTVQAGPIDLSTPSGRMVARQLCAVAQYESEHKSARIKRKVTELAEAGKIANGGPRPFGYVRVFEGEGPRRKIIRDEIEPTEAGIIREAATRLLAGDSLRSIVTDLNSAGVITSTGRTWTMQAMRWVLRSGRIAGLREHKGQVIGPASWPAIITEDQHKLLRARLDSNQRPPGSRVRLHYLSGHVYCQRCGVRMGVKPQHQKLKYVCPPKADGGCNGTVVGLVDLEALVGEYMVIRMSDPRLLRELAERETKQDTAGEQILARIEADERRLAVLRAVLEDGSEEDLQDIAASVRAIRARVREARAELASRSAHPAVVREDFPDLASRWLELPLARKQGLLRLFVDRIVIGPAVRGLGKFDPDRVHIAPVE